MSGEGAHPVPFTGAVLTGGLSTRMGRDKALLEVDGQALAATAAAALRGAGADPVLAVGGDGVALDLLGLTPVPDLHPGEGPLGGVLTALASASDDVVVILACDLPFVRTEGVSQVVAALAADPAAPAAVPVLDGRAQPLHAAWRRSVHAQVEAVFVAGERAVHRTLRDLGAVPVPGLAPRWLTNVNTEADLGRARWRDDPAAAGQTGAMSPSALPGNEPEIDVDELARRQDEGVWLLDVRQPDEYEEGHIPGARLIPLDQLEMRAGELPEEGEILVVCRSGARSATAVHALTTIGHRATNVAGGTVAWIEAGRPVVRGSRPG